MEDNKPNFFDFTLEQFQEFMVNSGQKKFRATQVFKWVYSENVLDVEKMTNLSKEFRAQLPDKVKFKLPMPLVQNKSVDGTMKFLFQVGQNLSVESVLIPGSGGRLTLCLSSEVGCNMACKFCYTGKQKLKRRLTTGEIVGQFYQVSKALPKDQKISNIVFMGMGEPLDNCDAVFSAIDIFTDSHGIGLSKKKITVSTSGIVPEMPRITESGTCMAVSLNGASDEVRSKVMPINKKWPIKDLLDACAYHCETTRQKVTFEYVLLKGVTDSIEDADRLYHLTKGIPCKINIIPFNEHPDSGFSRPEDAVVDRFQRKLISLGAQVFRRKTMGRDIYAACGQLTTLDKANTKSSNAKDLPKPVSSQI